MTTHNPYQLTYDVQPSYYYAMRLQGFTPETLTALVDELRSFTSTKTVTVRYDDQGVEVVIMASDQIDTSIYMTLYEYQRRQQSHDHA